MDNNKDEVDVKRFELGPGMKAIAMFIMLAMTVGGTWYVCKQNTKGDIAESEIEVRKNDNKEAAEMQEIHDRIIEAKKKSHAERTYDGWATKSLRDLRGVRIPEKYQSR